MDGFEQPCLQGGARTLRDMVGTCSLLSAFRRTEVHITPSNDPLEKVRSTRHVNQAVLPVQSVASTQVGDRNQINSRARPRAQRKAGVMPQREPQNEASSSPKLTFATAKMTNIPNAQTATVRIIDRPSARLQRQRGFENFTSISYDAIAAAQRCLAVHSGASTAVVCHLSFHLRPSWYGSLSMTWKKISRPSGLERTRTPGQIDWCK
mgnify:CR=1 FL=1